MSKRSKKICQRLDTSSVESWVTMQMSARMTENQVGMERMTLLPFCVMRTLKMIKMGVGIMETSKNQRIQNMMKQKVGPGTDRNTEEPQGTPLTQSYVSSVFMTQVMNEWAMTVLLIINLSIDYN